MYIFNTKIEIIDINPFVFIPEDIFNKLRKDSGKKTGPIPVKGTLQSKSYKQTLVKFRGAWRLYLNTPMRTASNTKVGDTATIEITYDPEPRIIEMPPLFREALNNSSAAKKSFEKLSLSYQKELLRYLGNLKTDEKLRYNIGRTIEYLEGKKIKGVLYRN